MLFELFAYICANEVFVFFRSNDNEIFPLFGILIGNCEAIAAVPVGMVYC